FTRDGPELTILIPDVDSKRQSDSVKHKPIEKVKKFDSGRWSRATMRARSRVGARIVDRLARHIARRTRQRCSNRASVVTCWFAVAVFRRDARWRARSGGRSAADSRVRWPPRAARTC